MTFEEVDRLLDEVTAFLLECGGSYQEPDGRVEKNVLECLAVDQFIIHRGSTGEITHFLCYWMVTPEAAGDLADGIRPQEITGGTVMFVIEHGNKDGRPGMTRMIWDIRNKTPQTVGAAWRHKGKAFVYFPTQRSQKGEKV